MMMTAELMMTKEMILDSCQRRNKISNANVMVHLVQGRKMTAGIILPKEKGEGRQRHKERKGKKDEVGRSKR
jgi:hypothetical protein